MKTQSLRGDFLDHAVDRYADIFIICGLFAGGLAPMAGWCSCLPYCVLMASYLGTQAQAVGVGRFYGGMLWSLPPRIDHGGRYYGPVYPVTFYGLTWLGWLMLMFGVLGHFTAFQRFAHVWANVK